MKYLTPIVLLLALCGCERNTPGSKDSVKVAVPIDIEATRRPADHADKSLKGRVSRAGLYRLVRSGGLIDDPNTNTGKAVVKPVVEMLKATQRIPLIKGSQMYLQYRIWPLPAQPAYADLRQVVKHPKINLPDGSVSTGFASTIKGRVNSNQVIAYTGYGLDEDYELVEGDWIFEIWYQDKKVIEQTFTTYRADGKEQAKLEPLLALGNGAVGRSKPAKKSFSQFDWPRITIGGTSAIESKGTK